MPLHIHRALFRNSLISTSFLCAFLFSFFTSFGVDADPVFTVRMKGYAEGIGLTARRLALEDAQHQVMVDILRSMTNSDDIAPFRGMLRKTSRYVQRYDLLRSDIIGQSTEVEIDAFILEKPLRHDVAAVMLPRLSRNPSILLLLAEYIGAVSQTGGPTFDVAETVLRDRVKDFKFTVNGMHSLMTHFDMLRLVDIINGDVADGAKFARANQEDVVVIGAVTVSHEPLQEESNMFRNRATATLRIFAGHDGKMMDIITSQAVVQSVDPIEGGKQAVQDACAKMTSDFVVAIVLTMLSLEDDNRALIEIENPLTPDTVLELSKVIESIPGVYGVETLFFSSSLARLAVDYQGEMANFADWVDEKMIGMRKVAVTRCVKREMTLSFE
ncbi:MAG: hypothetical protein KAH38_10950 [Candidatus Hydrogenedentes bacterium]|nr:hypothetical protein [Candidatus Hydrogenedentota bacterium]